MTFHVLTLFPEMLRQGLAPSIIGRAVEAGKIRLNLVNFREYTQERHGKVDDYPYGGGAGMVIQAQPVYDAYQAVSGGRGLRTIYVTPQGKPFTQKLARELAEEEELVFLCGHYEGVDERVLEEIVTDYVSIGDYILTGGELPVMVMIDVVARLLPGVLGNESSAEEESFHNDLLEYPQYSRPEIWRDKSVPGILLSGNHSKVKDWRLEQSKERTIQRRPDLYARYEQKQQLIKKLTRDKRNNIHMIESLKRGLGEIICSENGDVLIYDEKARVCMVLASEHKAGERLMELVPAGAELIVATQDFMRDIVLEQNFRIFGECSQYLYTARETLPVPYRNIRRLTMEHSEYVRSHYAYDETDALIRSGVMYGAFDGEKIIGFTGMHGEGSMGLLYVEEAYRGQKIAESLEAYNVNRMLEKGWTPYCHVLEGNGVSEHLQEKLGFYKASVKIWWMEKNCKKDK